jgi:hypothetical protein
MKEFFESLNEYPFTAICCFVGVIIIIGCISGMLDDACKILRGTKR